MKQIYIIMGMIFSLLFFVERTYAEPFSQDRSMEVACLKHIELTKKEMSPKQCSCQNDYYAKLLKPQDWKKYTEDYYALYRKQSMDYDTEANSYERYIQIGNDHCAECARNDFKGKDCGGVEKDEPSMSAYQRIFQDLHEGNFGQIRKNNQYKAFFVDFLNGYSKFCNKELDKVNSIQREIKTTHWREFGELEKVDTHIVRVDEKLFPIYESYESSATWNAIGDLVSSFFEDIGGNLKPNNSVKSIWSSIIGPVFFMRDKMDGKCQMSQVKNTYENLKNFEFNKPPFFTMYTASEIKKQKNERHKHYTKIRKLTEASYKRHWEIIGQDRIRRASLPRGEFNCLELYEEGEVKATTVDRGKGFLGLAGTWDGLLSHEHFEIALWNAGRHKTHTGGFAYITDQNCLMKITVNKRYAKGEKRTHFDFVPIPNIHYPQNCKSMVIEIEHAEREMREFRTNGFVSWSRVDRAIELYLAAGKLGRITPQSCSEVKKIKMNPSSISKEFSNALRQYSTKFPKAGIPANLTK